MALNLSISLVATVKNERTNLEAFLGGIANQSRPPDEFVIVDGGSTDGTWESLLENREEYGLTLLRVPGASISAGRNIAMSRCSGDVIAITDFGTVADRDWLERLVWHFADPNIDVVSGFFVPERRTLWQRALAATTLPDASEIKAEKFLPSSRSVAVRSSWIRRGFEYPEWLDYCEDLVWDLRLKDAGARFRFEPGAAVTFTGRESLRAFWRQYYLYARGDGKAGLFGRRHLIRYGTYIAAGLVILRRDRRLAMLGALFGVGYLRAPILRLNRRDRKDNHPPVRTVAALPLLPVIRFTGDVAKMVGYPVGVFWRWRRFGTLVPWKNWRRITTDGELRGGGSLAGAPRPPVD